MLFAVKKISAIIAVIMSFVCVFAACGGEEKSNSDNIIGVWSAEINGVSGTYEFKADGTGAAIVDGISFELTYTANGNKLTMVLDGTSIMENTFGMSVKELLDKGIITQAELDALYETIEATFKVKGDTLIIDGDVFTKVN